MSDFYSHISIPSYFSFNFDFIFLSVKVVVICCVLVDFVLGLF